MQHSLIVGDNDSTLRLDRFCSAALPHISREKIKRAILQGQCRVQGAVLISPSTRLNAGQVVDIDLPPAQTALTPEHGAITPLWHDDDLLVLNKAPGITVHPCPSCPAGTLVQRIAAHFPQVLAQEGLRPGIVHRLDKDTSGLLLVALSERARLALSAAFADYSIHKQYLALVYNVPSATGTSRAPLGRDPQSKVKMAVLPAKHPHAKAAHTEWRVLYADPQQRFALLCVTLHTGRTHQIRVHMAHAGHPLLGDSLYGPRKTYYGVRPPRQMLHAFALGLTHPITGEPLHFECPPPQDFLDTALALSHSIQKVVLTGLPGCGKSSLLRAFATHGIPTWSADTVVDSLYAYQGDGWSFLRGRYGERFAPDSAPINRTALRQAMTDNAHLRHEVEENIHAMTRHNLESFWTRHENAGETVAVAEIPLYLEAGWRTKGSDMFLIGVDCPDALRHERLLRDRGWDAARCRTLDAWQWPPKRKMAACDTVLDNSNTKHTLTAVAETLLRILAKRSAEHKAELALHIQSRYQSIDTKGICQNRADRLL